MYKTIYSFTALESKLVNQFCEDENGALIYNHLTNGPWNGNNGLARGIGGNNGQWEHANGYNGQGNNGYGNSINTGNSYNLQEERNQNKNERLSSRSRGDTFSLPISADPLPAQVSRSYFKLV